MLTFEQLARGRRRSWPDALRTEFRIAAHLCTDAYPSDMHEGVRCALIDRGSRPSWRYARVADVPAAAIDQFFDPVAGIEDLDLPSPRL